MGSDIKKAVEILPGPLSSSSPDPNYNSGITKLVTSKTWTVPPKPKKGPKPMAKNTEKSEPVRRRYVKLKPADGAKNETAPPVNTNANANEQQGFAKTDNVQDMEISLDCGLCDAGGDCACDALGIKPKFNINRPDESPVFGISFEPFEAQKAVPLSRHHSRSSTPNYRGFKRLKSDSKTEITGVHDAHSHSLNDTHSHSHASNPHSSHSHSQQMNNVSCSFCGSLDTSCVCGNEDQEAKSQTSKTSMSSNSVLSTPASSETYTETPPPTSNATSNAAANISVNTSSAGTSANLPATTNFSAGSCQSCMNDPLCTLFCLSLASADKGDSMLKSSPLTISCSQAYQSLSRHKGFSQRDLGLIVNNLKSHAGKVDVQSIATALRDLEQAV